MKDARSENELLQASLAGNKEAFGIVVQRYQALVCAITYSATGDIGKSEELAQETFLRGWKNLRQLEDLSSFRAWLCTIARNLVSQSLRRRPQDVIRTAHPLEQAEAVAAATSDPEQAAIDKEVQEAVWAAVRRVPQKYREPLVLFYREQQSISRVAADLGLSEERVRQRLHRGRQLLRAEVASLVEDALAHSGPGRTFSIAVVAALPAILTPAASAAVAGIIAKGTPIAKTLWAACFNGAILGPILGILGAVLGILCDKKDNCSPSPRERRFVIRMVIFSWLLALVVIGVPVSLASVGLVPPWMAWLGPALYCVLLVPLIHWGIARRRRLQMEEGTCRPYEHRPPRLTRRGVYGNFGGSIFGASLWLLILSGIVQDWMSFGAILGGDTLLALFAARLYVRHPQRYWSVAFGMVCALTAMTLVIINLRWTAWMHAYRQSAAYEPTNDVSLTTINLLVLGVFVFLVVGFAAQYVQRRAARQRQEREDRRQP
jgi:RNA polymerase sigma factor (sigma-70 family)